MGLLEEYIMEGIGLDFGNSVKGWVARIFSQWSNGGTASQARRQAAAVVAASWDFGQS